MNDEENKTDDCFGIPAEVMELFKNRTPPEAEARAYMIVNKFKEIENPSIDLQADFVSWIMFAEIDDKTCYSMKGITRWYEEFEPEALAAGDGIGAWEFEKYVDHIIMCEQDAEKHLPCPKSM